MEQLRKTEESISQQMTYEEARNVMWLRNRPEFYKPLGILLDEGYLTRDRLKWAAETAYNPQLKEAATVILDSLERSKEEPNMETSRTPAQAAASPLHSVNIDISIEHAQNTIWPFSLPPNCKGQPMGPLINARQLGIKDLAYAIEKAWEKRLKQAATVFMLQQLNQTLNEPSPSKGSLKIVSCGRTFAERKQLQLSLWLGMLLGAIILVPIFLYVLFLTYIYQVNRELIPEQFIKDLTLFLFTHFELPHTIGAVKITAYAVMILIALLPAALITWAFKRTMNYIIDRIWENIDNYRKGQEGEDKVVETIISNLDEEWALFRNISLPGRKKSDLDLILVGPPGVWVLEVKNFTGEYKYTGEDWEYRAGKIWKALKKNPGRQAQNNALNLSKFLKEDGIKQYVKSIVVWANEESLLTVENPVVAVWRYDRLPEELGNLWQNRPMEQTQQKRIEGILANLCQK